MNFTISPHPKGRGFALASDDLAYPMWYGSVEKAASYARWFARVKGGQIETRDEKGEVVAVEEIAAGEFAY